MPAKTKKLNFFFWGGGANFLVKCFPALNLLQSVYMSYFPSFLPFSLCLHLFEGHSGVNESIVPEGEGRLCREDYLLLSSCGIQFLLEYEPVSELHH